MLPQSLVLRMYVGTGHRYCYVKHRLANDKRKFPVPN